MNMLSESGLTAEDIAKALINKRVIKEIKNIPDVKTVRYRNDIKNSGGKRTDVKVSKVDINVGRLHKIAPNFILGALVDATAVSYTHLLRQVFFV